ncbi:Glycosyltransferase like family 2 [uncultured archaeon]|nr:Glycosyltransferase like family 2 [uncultured archaeon]
MISIIVTAFESPDYTKECIERILNQDIQEEYELIAACPDKPTKKIIMDYKKNFPKLIKYIHQDYTCSKNQLMNNILQIAKGRILIWTDGNKFFEKDAINLLLKPFQDEKVGVVGGRIIPLNNKGTIYDVWANVLTKGLHKMREKRFQKRTFIEHSSNILAMRSGIIKKIPLDVAEGSVISFLITNKGYKNVYVKEAMVLVKYPKGLKECFKQRARSAKAHMELLKYSKNSRIKYNNFYNQVLSQILKNIFKEFFQSLLFVFFMIFVQLRAYFSLRIRKKNYIARWIVEKK